MSFQANPPKRITLLAALLDLLGMTCIDASFLECVFRCVNNLCHSNFSNSLKPFQFSLAGGTVKFCLPPLFLSGLNGMDEFAMNGVIGIADFSYHLFRLVTSAGWNDVLEPLLVTPPGCDPHYKVLSKISL